MIHWVSGPAYAGKTTLLYQLTQSLCARGERVFFFVPEQQTAEAEAELFRRCSNRANETLEVLNFQRLPNRVFRTLGGLVKSDFGRTERALTLARIIEGFRDRLPLFSAALKDADLLGSLLSMIELFLRSDVSAETLESIAKDPRIEKERQLQRKLSELSLLCAAYEKACTELCRGRTPDELRRLIERLDERSDCNFFEGVTVCIDGFYDFTAPEYELILRMGRMAKDLYVTFLVQEGQEDLFFRCERAKRTLERLCRDLECETIRPEELLRARENEAPEDLAFLCDHVINAPKAPYPKVPERIRVKSALSPLEEVRGALREIFLLHAQGKLDYSDCAILYRSGALYDPLLREEAARAGIPLYTGEQKSLLFHPLSLFFRSAARIASGDTRRETLIELLQTGLLPLSPGEIGLLERYLNTWDLSGAALYRKDPFTANPRGYQKPPTEQSRIAANEELEQINAAKDTLFSKLERLKEAFAAPDFAGKVNALKSFAESCGVPDRISESITALRGRERFSEASVEEGLFSACLSALDALAAQTGEVGPELFNVYLKLAFSFLSVGALPSSPNALAAGEISFARLKKVRYLYLIGVNAELFPAAGRDGGVLSDRECELCASLEAQFEPFDPGGAMEEYFYFYLAAATPTDRLTISYHTRSLAGKECKKSVFLSRLAFLFPQLELSDASACDADLSESSRTRARDLPINESELYSYLCVFRESRDPFTLRLRRYAQKHALFDLPKTREEQSALRDRRAPCEPHRFLILSQGKLDTYAKCPYRYFLHYDLNLRPDPTAELDRSVLGSLAHYVAEYSYRKIEKLDRPIGDYTAEDRQKLVQMATNEFFADLLPAGARVPARFHAQAERMEHANLRLLENLFRDSAQSAYRPFCFEAQLGHELPAYFLDLPDGSQAKFSGMVDRIDLARINGQNYACVIDYKTGEHKFDVNDVYNGLESQLIVYLCALRAGGIVRNGKRVPVIPAAGYYLHAYSGVPKAIDEKTAQAEINKHLSRCGLYLKDDTALGAFGASVRNGFRIEKTKGPKAAAGSELLSAAELDALLDTAEDLFAETALKIKSGNVARLPLKKGKRLIDCEYCDYRSICRLENGACRRYVYRKTAKDEDPASKEENGKEDADA